MTRKHKMAALLLAMGIALATLFGGHAEAQATGYLSDEQAWQMYTGGASSSWWTTAGTFSYNDWAWLDDYEGYWRSASTSTWWHYWTPSTRYWNTWYVTNLSVDSYDEGWYFMYEDNN